MTTRARRMLTASVAAAAAVMVAGPATATGSAPPEPEVLGSQAPQVQSTQTVTGPYQLNFSGALLYALIYPNAEAPRVNDYSCTPEEGAQPVILVHGTYANQYDSFARMAPELAWEGHCLYSFNYGTDGDSAIAQVPGRYGTTGLAQNAEELEDFAAAVMARTGTDEVDMLGWSQGGTLISDYLKENGGGAVDDVITYGATHHGTTLLGLATLARGLAGEDAVRAGLGQAGVDQIRGSAYMEQLTSTPDTVPGVEYTVVGSRYDEVSTPYRATFLEEGPGATVHNITLQDGCWIDHSDHLSMMYSPRAIDIAKRALDPDGEGWLRCRYNAPLL